MEREAPRRGPHRATERRAEAFARFERATEVPMLVLALAMLPVILLPEIVALPPLVERTFLAVSWIIWAAFALELTVKTYLAPRRGRYLVQHWFDVLIVALPFLRPLRVARSARLLRALWALRAGVVLVRVGYTGWHILRRHHLDYALATAGALVVLAAAGVMFFEREAGGEIDDFGTALWWALTTVTTVGYGDYAPQSAAGRGIAVFLMLIGIGLFGLLTANIAAFFVESNSKDRAADEASNREILEEVRALRRRLEEQPHESNGSDVARREGTRT